MTVTMDAGAQIDLAVGQLWTIRVRASSLPVMVVILPDGTTESSILFAADGWLGDYVASFAPQDPGRYLAAITTLTDGVVTGSVVAQAFVAPITMNSQFPGAADLDKYLGEGQHGWTTEELEEAMAIESAAQRRVCRIPAAYPADLRGALVRRGARYLDMKRQMTSESSDGTDFEVPGRPPLGRDQEIRRLEAPWRKVVIG